MDHSYQGNDPNAAQWNQNQPTDVYLPQAMMAAMMYQQQFPQAALRQAPGSQNIPMNQLTHGNALSSAFGRHQHLPVALDMHAQAQLLQAPQSHLNTQHHPQHSVLPTRSGAAEVTHAPAQWQLDGNFGATENVLAATAQHATGQMSSVGMQGRGAMGQSTSEQNSMSQTSHPVDGAMCFGSKPPTASRKPKQTSGSSRPRKRTIPALGKLSAQRNELISQIEQQEQDVQRHQHDPSQMETMPEPSDNNDEPKIKYNLGRQRFPRQRAPVPRGDTPPPLEPSVLSLAVTLPAVDSFPPTKIIPDAVLVDEDGAGVNKYIKDAELLKSLQANRYLCDFCPKRFKDRVGAANHLRVHTGERPFKCKYCPQEFKAEYHVRQHERLHTGERPYECGLCPSRFAQMTSLLVHNASHHGSKKPYLCDVCGKSFGRKLLYDTHALTHTGERPFECSECGKRFMSDNALKNHTRVHDRWLPRRLANRPPQKRRATNLYNGWRRGAKTKRVCHGDATLIPLPGYVHPAVEWLCDDETERAVYGKKLFYVRPDTAKTAYFCLGCLQKDPEIKLRMRVLGGKLYSERPRPEHVCNGLVRIGCPPVDFTNFKIQQLDEKDPSEQDLLKLNALKASGPDFGPADMSCVTAAGRPAIRHHSRRWPGIVFEFFQHPSNQSQSACIHTYACSGCHQTPTKSGNQKKSAAAKGRKAGKKVIYRIRVADGRLYDDPDGEEHVCVRKGIRDQSLPAAEAREFCGRLYRAFKEELDNNFSTLYGRAMSALKEKHAHNPEGLQKILASVPTETKLFVKYKCARGDRLLKGDAKYNATSSGQKYRRRKNATRLQTPATQLSLAKTSPGCDQFLDGDQMGRRARSSSTSGRVARLRDRPHKCRSCGAASQRARCRTRSTALCIYFTGIR